jgi:hypothetical protein
MLTAWGYFRRILKTAFTQSIGPIDIWTGIAGAALGIVDHFWPERHLMTSLAWQLPLWALGAVLLVRLFLAPFRIAKEDDQRIRSLNAQRKVQIDQERKQAAIDDLSEELSWAIHNLLNRNQGKEWTEEMVPPFEADMNAWCEKVNKKLEDRDFFSRSDQLHFDRLGFLQPIDMGPLARLNWLMSMLRMKFDRLREVIGRNQTRS